VDDVLVVVVLFVDVNVEFDVVELVELVTDIVLEEVVNVDVDVVEVCVVFVDEVDVVELIELVTDVVLEEFDVVMVVE
jgi:hypothetical protein